jgi:hypothetical protein
VAFLTLKGRNRKASSIANGAYIYRNDLPSAIVKQLTPEDQPQLIDRGAALSSLVVRGGDAEVEVFDAVFVDPERVLLNG